MRDIDSGVSKRLLRSRVRSTVGDALGGLHRASAMGDKRQGNVSFSVDIEQSEFYPTQAMLLTKLNPFLCSAILSLLLAGCDSDYTGTGKELLRQIAVVNCQTKQDCDSGRPDGDEPNCARSASPHCIRPTEECATAYTFSRADWDSCLDALEDRPCGDVDRDILPLECETLLDPRLAEYALYP